MTYQQVLDETCRVVSDWGQGLQLVEGGNLVSATTMHRAADLTGTCNTTCHTIAPSVTVTACTLQPVCLTALWC